MITYLVGTVGVASIIAVAVIAAQKAGWLDKAQSTVSQIELLSLPSAPQAGLGDVLQGLTGNVRKVEQSTTTLWQRGNEHPRRLNQK